MAKGKYHKWLTDEGMTLLEGWARDGLTDEQIAYNMGIAVRTLYVWKERFHQIMHSLKKGKEVADFEVENALYKRALGYNYEEVKTHVEELNGKKKKKVEKTHKHIPADVTAQIFWLKNRKPKEWRDKQDLEHTGNIGVTIIDNIPKSGKK